MEAGIFYLLAAITIVPAFLVVTMRNIFHSALFLILSVLGVAGLYAMLAADFVFTVQLLVYAGGIMVILLFVILLSGKPSDFDGAPRNEQSLLAGVVAALFAATVVTVFSKWPMTMETVAPQVTTARLGSLFLNEMILPFEFISLVLVTALVGAIFFANRKKT